MANAFDERQQWRSKMERGIIPNDVERSILLYNKMRNDPYWRGSKLLECLGEAALLWFEQSNKNKNKETIPCTLKSVVAVPGKVPD